jgi:hypothetical protein
MFHQNPPNALRGVEKTKLKGQTDKQTARLTAAVYNNSPVFYADV